MATVKHLGAIDRILRKAMKLGRDLPTLVREAGIQKDVWHASQLTDEEADQFIKTHGVYLMKSKKGKQ